MNRPLNEANKAINRHAGERYPRPGISDELLHGIVVVVSVVILGAMVIGAMAGWLDGWLEPAFRALGGL